MNGNSYRNRTTGEIDARSIQVEVPEHKGILLPVVDIKFTFANNSAQPKKAYFVVLCKFCDKYHYVQVKEGDIAGLPPLAWNA